MIWSPNKLWRSISIRSTLYLRIRDLYPGSRILDLGSVFFPSRIRIKEFKYINPKKWFLSFRKYDPGCSSQIPDPADPRVKKASDPGSGSATLFNRWPPTQTAVTLAPPPRPLRSSSCPADRPPQLLVGWPAHTCKSTPIRARIFSTLKEPNNQFQGINSASLHCKENTNYVILFWELHGLSPNFHIHMSVSDLYIPRIGPHTVFPCRKIDRPLLEIYKSLTDI